MKLYLVRHGTSQHQRMHRGRMPGIHLTSKGRREATKTAAFLRKKKITVIYTSPLERAQETAQIIAKSTKAKVIVAPELNEWNLMVFQGLLPADAKRKNPRAWKEFVSAPTKIHDNERITAVAARMMKFYKRIQKKHPEKTIVAVSHAGPIAALLLTLTHHSLDELHTTAKTKGWHPGTGGIVEVQKGLVKQVHLA